jgi:hypothetical protein
VPAGNRLKGRKKMKKGIFAALAALVFTAAHAGVGAQSVAHSAPVAGLTGGEVNASCSPNDIVVLDRDRPGKHLTCESGRFIPMNVDWVIQSSYRGVRNNDFIRAPQCGKGETPEALVEGVDKAGVPDVAGSATYSLFKADGGWRLNIVRVDASGHVLSPGVMTATVRTVCAS